jgi:HEAT repeat protein
MQAHEIVRLLSVDTPNWCDDVERIASEAATAELAAASRCDLPAAAREILFDLLGNRYDPTALPALIDGLNDVSPSVRSSAADALAKIRDPAAGPFVERKFKAEEDDAVRQMLAIALGAVDYQPSIPALIRALGQSKGTLSGAIAWSLGALKARGAEDALRLALSRETSSYALTRIADALSIIQSDV